VLSATFYAGYQQHAQQEKRESNMPNNKPEPSAADQGVKRLQTKLVSAAAIKYPLESISISALPGMVRAIDTDGSVIKGNPVKEWWDDNNNKVVDIRINNGCTRTVPIEQVFQKPDNTWDCLPVRIREPQSRYGEGQEGYSGLVIGAAQKEGKTYLLVARDMNIDCVAAIPKNFVTMKMVTDKTEHFRITPDSFRAHSPGVFTEKSHHTYVMVIPGTQEYDSFASKFRTAARQMLDVSLSGDELLFMKIAFPQLNQVFGADDANPFSTLYLPHYPITGNRETDGMSKTDLEAFFYGEKLRAEGLSEKEWDKYKQVGGDLAENQYSLATESGIKLGSDMFAISPQHGNKLRRGKITAIGVRENRPFFRCSTGENSTVFLANRADIYLREVNTDNLLFSPVIFQRSGGRKDHIIITKIVSDGRNNRMYCGYCVDNPSQQVFINDNLMKQHVGLYSQDKGLMSCVRPAPINVEGGQTVQPDAPEYGAVLHDFRSAVANILADKTITSLKQWQNHFPDLEALETILREQLTLVLSAQTRNQTLHAGDPVRCTIGDKTFIGTVTEPASGVSPINIWRNDDGNIVVTAHVRGVLLKDVNGSLLQMANKTVDLPVTMFEKITKSRISEFKFWAEAFCEQKICEKAAETRRTNTTPAIQTKELTDAYSL